jgi:RHS repeat-associated protein
MSIDRTELITKSLGIAQSSLQEFADSPSFITQVQAVFGNDILSDRLHTLGQLWRDRDFSLLPTIEIRTAAELLGAQGAYAGASNTIYLSQDFLSRNIERPDIIAQTLLTEIGHAVDWWLRDNATSSSPTDAVGDEGTLFAAQVLEHELAPEQWSLIQAEDDSAVLLLDGQPVSVEQEEITWNGATGNWSDSTNWSPEQVPGLEDSAIVLAGTVTVDVPSIVGSLDFNNSVLSVNADFEVGDFDFNGTSLSANNLITMTGDSSWTTGTISGSSGLTNSGTFTIEGNAQKSFYSVLTNAGTIIHNTDGNLDVLKSTINNLTGAVYTIQQGSFFRSKRYVNHFNNSGLFQKLGPETASLNGIYFNLAPEGTLSVEEGTLALSGGGDSTGGTIHVAEGATLEYGGIIPNVGSFEHYFDGNYSGEGTGTIRIKNGQLIFQEQSSFVTPSALEIASDPGSINLQTLADSEIEVGDFHFSGGRTALNGSLTATGDNSIWTGGILGGSAGLLNEGTLTISGENLPRLTGLLTNNNTIVHGTTDALDVIQGTINNLTNAVYIIQQGNFIRSQQGGTGGNYFDNSGLFQKVGSETSTLNNINFNLAPEGTLSVEEGTLALNGGGDNTGGTIHVAEGATLEYGGGSHRFSGEYIGTGTGTIRVSNSNIFFEEGSHFTTPATLEVTGGLLQALADSAVEVGDLHFSGGDIRGTATVTATGENSRWTGGILNGSLTNTGTLFITGDSRPSINGILNNSGTIIHNAPIFQLNTQERYPFINNLVGSVYELQQGEFLNLSTTNNYSHFNNSGLVRKTGDTTVTLNPKNSFNLLPEGTLSVEEGTLTLNGYGTRTGGTVLVHDDAVLDYRFNFVQPTGLTQLTGGTLITPLVDIQSGELSGFGTVTSNVRNAALFEPGLLNDTPFGVFEISGNYTETDTANINIDLGGTGLNEFDQIDIGGTATFDGTINIDLIQGYTPQLGDSFEVFNYASYAGTPEFRGLDLGRGLFLSPEIDDDGITLEVVGSDVIDDTLMTAKDLGILVGTQTVADLIGGSDANDYYKFEVVNRSSVELSLGGLTADAEIAILNRQGSELQRVIASELSNGSINLELAADRYYVRVLRSEPEPTPYTLELSGTPLVEPFGILEVTPDAGGNLGETTVAISGNQFTPGATVSLVDEAGSIYAADSTRWLNSTSLSSTFDLTGLTADTYDVQVSDTAGTATADDSFTINLGTTGQIEAFLSVPRNVRPWGTANAVVSYRNVGDTDVVAPLFILEADSGQLRDPGSERFVEGSVQFLGINNEGLAGILPAGASNSISISFKPPSRISTIHFTLRKANEDALMDWEAFKDAVQPEGMSSEVCDVVCENFVSAVGDTVGDYQAALADNASYLSQFGDYTHDVGRLLGFEIQQASNATQEQSIAERYHLGSLGRGRRFVGDVRIVTDEDGNVILEDAGFQRFFTQQADGSYQGASGDLGTLTLVGDVYQLEEAGGILAQFLPNGRLDFVEDANGNRVTAAYSGDQLTELVSSTGNSFTFAYTQDGRISAVTDQSGRTTTYGYDAAGEVLLSMTEPGGNTITYTYNDDFAVTSITDATGVQQQFEYDNYGRLIQRNLNDGAAVFTYSYDSAGGVTITDAMGASTQVLRDDRGQVAQATDALGRAFQYFYDEDGNLVHSVTPDDTSYVFSYDDRGNLISQVDPSGQRTLFTYEPSFDRLTSFTDARDNTVRYTYDESGNLLSILYADGSAETFTPDDRGNIVAESNRRGQTTTYTYSDQGQLLQQNNTDGSFQQYTYDDRGNLTSAADVSGTTAMVFDSADRLTQITYANGLSLAYSYDVAGRRTQMVDQDGNTVNYFYDNAGRLERLTDGNNDLIVQYSYDAVGRLDITTKGNDTWTDYDYDAAGQLTGLFNYAPDGSVNSSFEYTYDRNGWRTQETSLDGQWTYSYDPTGQLTRAIFDSTNPEIDDQDLTYVYDAVGNRVRTIFNGETTEYSANNLNQYLSAGDTTFVYDTDGNLISKTEANGDTWTYTYNAQNRLVQVIEPDGSETHYEYDVLGNRTATIYNGERTDYLIDPFGLGDVVGEYDSNGISLSNYTHGIGLVSQTNASNITAYYDFNAIGSTISLSNTTGDLLNQYSYRPFGQDIFENETVANPFEFVGQWGVIEDKNNLDFMRNRYFHSESGRFQVIDPINISGGDINLYRYAVNSPITLVDPLGLKPDSDDLAQAKKCQKDPNKWGEFLQKLAGIAAIGAVGGIAGGPLGTVAALCSAAGGGLQVGVMLDECLLVQEEYDPNSPIPPSQPSSPPNPSPSDGGYPTPPSDGGYPTPPSDGGCSTPPSDEGLPPGGYPNPPSEPPTDEGETDVNAPIDPNEIYGPTGYGDDNWLATQPLPYEIAFENLETASAPAVLVNVSHTLDSDLDLDTFELSNFGFGDLQIEVPGGFQEYHQRLDLRDSINAYVDFDASLDPDTRTVTWTLTTIDPDTGELAIGVDDGFLPPNVDEGEGEGYVTFFVQPTAGLTTGTTIDADAEIVFDFNDAISTSTNVTTLDNGDPDSAVAALPATTTDTDFEVTWSGTDDGSGIAFYDIYVSVDDAPHNLWLDNTTATAATYSGEVGRTYSFYSVAQDYVGHIEAPPLVPDTTTTVDALVSNHPPTLSTISQTVAEDTTLPFTLTDFTSAFADTDGDSLNQIQILSLPTDGLLTLSGIAVTPGQEIDSTSLNALTFTPTLNFNGTISFSWNGFDGTTYAALPALVNLMITAVNDPPVAIDDAASTTANIPITIDVLSNDADIDGDALTLSAVGTPSQGNVVINNNGTVTYTPNPGFSGDDNFTYTTSDGQSTSQANVAVSVSAAESSSLRFSITGSTQTAQELVALLPEGESVPLITLLGNASGLPQGLAQDFVTTLAGQPLTEDIQFQLRPLNSHQPTDLTIQGSITDDDFVLTADGLAIEVTRLAGTDIPQPLTVTFDIDGDNSGPVEGISLDSLIGSSGKVTVQVAATLYREAAFDNLIGFYLADKATGDVIDPLTGNVQGSLSDSATAYRQTVRDYALIQGQVGNHQTGGLIDDTFIINADFNLEEYALLPFIDARGNGDLSTLYVASLGANADQADHIQLIGNDMFGFEDLFGGGDNDFDDMIMQITSLNII